jgi:tetratricopeptide (TPR) repeat protein
MKNKGRTAGSSSWLPTSITWIGRWLVLVPEAAILVTLLIIYGTFGNPPLLAFLAALIILAFTVRTAALHLARTMFEAGQYREANALLYLALLLYPWSADALALHGTFALATGKLDVAEESLRKAILLLPGQASFYTALSSVLLELGRPVEALQAARKAIELDNKHAQAYLYLAEAERASGIAAHVTEESLRTGIAAAQNPEVLAALQCVLASHLLAEKRIAEATLILRAVEAVLSRCSPPKQAELKYHLGKLLAIQGQVDRAREQFQDVEVLDPNGRFASAAWRAARL